MGIDLNSYRLRIGIFQSTGRPKQQKRKLKRKKGTRIDQLKIFIWFFILPAVLSWAYSCSTNKVMHSLDGNRKLGYKIASWNCNRGLLKTGSDVLNSDKLVDVKMFIQEHRPHLFAILESDLHGKKSRTYRKNYLTTENIMDQLKIEGYSLHLPDTWYKFDQARLIVYINDDIKYKKTTVDDNINDLPTLTFEVGLGREKKTLVNFFYREWTGGIEGHSDQASQVDRLTRQVQYWKVLASQDRDLVILGDANLCAKVWNNSDYPTEKKQLASIVNDFLLEETLVQTVGEVTRTELKGNNLERSCIDHIYVNCPNKCKESVVVPGGSSDHLAIMTTKFSREIPQKPKAVKKRSYKNFVEKDFIREVKFTKFDEVLNTNVPEEATESFTRIFNKIIDNHAPIKIFLTRNNYAPWLSEETKRIMKERDRLKCTSKESQDINVLKQYRKLRNQIKEINKKEEKEYYMKEFKDAGDRNDSRKMWGLSYDILGSKKNLSPNQLIIDGNLCSNPKVIAEEFNKLFICGANQEVPVPVSLSACPRF